ncbi:hypothetical protein GCM10029964_034170 [Kibdelosporangium lantanae]
MGMRINRRAAFGLGTAAVATATLGTPALADEDVSPATPDLACSRVRRVYERAAGRAGGTWWSYISVAGADGTPVAAVDTNSDTVIEAWSVNKVPVAMAVLDKVDRGCCGWTSRSRCRPTS